MCPSNLDDNLIAENKDRMGPKQTEMSLPQASQTRNKPMQSEPVTPELLAGGDQSDASFKSIDKFKTTADKARQAYANETATNYYRLALETLHAHASQPDAVIEFELLAGRETCYGLMGRFAEQQADLNEMQRLAGELNDIPRQIQVMTSQVVLDITLGNYIEAQKFAIHGLKLARKSGNSGLEAVCLLSLGSSSNSLADFSYALSCHKKAIRIFRRLGDINGEAQSLRRMGECLRDMGQSARSQENAEKAYAIFRTQGDQQGQAGCLNILGTVTRDMAWARSYYEQALLIFQTIGDHTWQANLYNNLGLVYWRLGLYTKARDYLEQAVQTVRDMQGRSSLASFLESLGRIYIEMGKYSEARQVLEEGLDLSEQIGDRLSETTYLMMLGRVALASGELEKARDLTQRACDMQRNMGTQGYLVTSLAWLGAVHLEMGNLEAADRFTKDAIEQLAIVEKASEFPTQDIWWLRYQVLKTEQRSQTRASSQADHAQINISNDFRTLIAGDVVIDEQAWICLQNARDAMLAGILTLSDDGLRRNYLNKVKFNRDILIEWAQVSSAWRKSDFSQLDQHANNSEAGLSTESVSTHDRLKRLLDISLQMNATLNPDALLDFVMDNVIELSGAERGFLVLVNESGELISKVERDMDQDKLNLADYPGRYPLLDKVIQTKIPILLDFSESLETQTAANGQVLNQRSAMCLPLLRRSGLIGMIYADNSSITGRFSQADLDLLSLFANQAATAIENARFFRERERRITELSILDEISRSLSSTLNLEELLETVYQQVGRIFDVTNFHIATYQEGDAEWVAAFQVDHGQRQPALRVELGLGLTGYILRSRETVMLNSTEENKLFKEAHGIPPVGTLAQSWMGVPLLTADRIVGAMGIQSYATEFLFDEHALNLFSTIGAQVAIAIRNTRLYEEKSRANKELESFSYSVSHDLRAPIRAINGFSRILLEDYSDSLDEEGKKHLRRVSEAGLRMGVLIDDILRLSRVTRSEIRRGPVELSQLASGVINELKSAASKERQVEVVIAPDLIVNADMNLLRIVLENLLGNAWKFTQKHPSARIELGVTERDNNTTYFVRDDGAGFDMAYVNKLFGAFQRLHDDSEFEGSGIGLATVQRIIQRHGGVVWAEGAVEKGATFYFTLPG